MRSLVVIACYEETNSVWSLSISLSANLHLVAKISDHAGHRQGCVVAVSRAETLVPHPSRDRPSVGSEASDGDSDMIVDGEDLLLMTANDINCNSRNHHVIGYDGKYMWIDT